MTMTMKTKKAKGKAQGKAKEKGDGKGKGKRREELGKEERGSIILLAAVLAAVALEKVDCAIVLISPRRRSL